MSTRIDVRREKIMDAALEVFREEGFERASIDKIVERSGGSKATLYKLFANKEGLFFAILRRAADRIGEAERPAGLPADAMELRALLTAIGSGIVRNVLTERIIGLYQLAVEGARHLPELGRLYFDGGPRKAQGDFALLLEEIRKTGLLAFDDGELAARFFFGMLLDKHHLAMSLGVAEEIDEAEAARLVRGAVEVFMKAYSPGAA